MAYNYNLTDDTQGILNQITSPSAVPQVYAVEPLASQTAAYSQPSAATGYLGGSALADAMAAAYAANPAAMTAMTKSPYDYTFNVSSNKGNPTGEVGVTAQTPIALVDNRTGKLVFSGVGVDAAKKAQELAAGLTSAGGNKATWSIYTAPAGATSSDQFTQVAYEKPNKSLGSTLLSVAAPVLGSILLPGVGGAIGGALTGALGSVGTGALGAALGSAALGTARGEGIGDILQNAALAGGTSYLGGTLLNQLSGAPASATKATQAGGLLSDVGPIATPLTSAQIANLTSDLALPLVSGTAGGALSTFGEPIVVTGSKVVPNLASGLGAGLGGALAPVVSATGDEMILTQQAQQPQKPDTALPTPDFSGVGPIATPLTPEQIAAATGGAGATAPGVGVPSSTAPSSTLNNIADWLRLAGIGTSLIGGLAGSGGSGTGATISGNMSGLNSLFNATLPSANLPGATTARAPRDMSGTDWNRYAFGPEKSFFTDVPQGLAEGGMPDGRSDDIPAMLSNGEYVIDAETMALLGNGDPHAGADRMDEWRVNVRKHKGRELARGKISHDAKMPEQYLGGGRV